MIAIIFIATLFLFVQKGINNQKKSPEKNNFHVSMYYYDNTDFFPKSIETFKDTKPISNPPHIFIVNQHILAAHLIAQQFALSLDPKVKTVVLITQNNWNAGHSPIIVSGYDWKTPLGNIDSAKELESSLINKRIASEEEGIFTNEHGITGIIPYVAHSFPNAKIVPIVIRDGTSDELVDALANQLSKLDISTTAIIGTIDMSHYLPKSVADAHDRLTIQSIKSFDYETLPRLDIDTVPTLRTIMKVAENAGQKTFVQTGGMNSADIVGDPDLVSTTSYITGYFKQGVEVDTQRAMHMLFVGDIMLDRGVAKHAEKYGKDALFSKVDRLFLGTDAVIGNLEGTLTNNASVSRINNSILHFTFDKLFAPFLKKFNFSVLSLANNHALDFGKDGYADTVHTLLNSNLGVFGSPRNDQYLSTKISLQGKTVCFVGYHDLFVPDATSAMREIKNIRPVCSYIVLFAHWGNEYQLVPTERQIKLAHSFIDAGADLIIGSHPHVVEPVEIYNNKAIFYSLGNFIFDQKLSYWTEHGLALNVEWDNAKTLFTLTPTTIENTEVNIANTEDSRKVISQIIKNDFLSEDIGSDILKTNKFILWNNNLDQTERTK